MGVKGLQGFMKRNAKMQAHKLRDCNLVIDAANFVHHLHSISGCEHRFAGDYDQYCRFVREVFEKFRSCRVNPLFVFDGAKDWDGAKLEEQMRRLRERVQKCRSLQSGNWQRCRLLPIVTYESFGLCVAEFDFASVTVVEGDADEQMAALAASLRCPILSMDSDFYVFELPGGVIPTDSLDLRPGIGDGVDCRLYRVGDSGLSLQPQLLPICASLAGNDYSQPGGDSLQALLGNRFVNIQSVVEWARRLGNRDACERAIRERLKAEQLRQIDASLRHYELRPGLSLSPSNQLQFGDSKLPAGVRQQLLRRQQKLVFFIDALVFRRVMLPVGIELLAARCVFDAAREWRRVAYSAETRAAGLEVQGKTVTELSRSGEEVQQHELPLSPHTCSSSWSCVLHQVSPETADSLSTCPELSGDSAEARGRRLLLYILKFAFASLQQQQQLQQAAGCWLQAQLSVFLLRCCLRTADAANCSAEDAANCSAEDAANCSAEDAANRTLRSLAESGQRDAEGQPLLLAAHCCNELQACLISAMLLLQSHPQLECLLPPPDKFLLGKVVCSVCCSLMSGRLSKAQLLQRLRLHCSGRLLADAFGSVCGHR